MYAAQLGRLQAADTLRDIAIVRIGSAGEMKPAKARRAVEKIEKAADDGRRRPADPRRLRAAGIAVEHRTSRR